MDCLADSWNVAIKSFIVTKDKSFKVYSKKLMLLIINFTQNNPAFFQDMVFTMKLMV